MIMMAEKVGSGIIERSNDVDLKPEGTDWSNPGDFPDFTDDKPKSNIEKLQGLLDRVEFMELRKDPE